MSEATDRPEAADPPPFEVLRAEGAARVVLLCDHASNSVPGALGTLGLEPARLREHIAWDPGAAAVARALSAALDAPLVLSGYSRLVIDCNRPPGAPTSVVEKSAGVVVPGNAGLTAEERAYREERYFWPYHRAVEALLRARDARGQSTAILSVHSFTPEPLAGPRPWHAAVVYGRDRRLAGLLLDALCAHEGLVLGDNEPYRITDTGDYGIPVYAERAGRPGVLFELRQDEVAEESGALRWASRLAEAWRASEGSLFPA